MNKEQIENELQAQAFHDASMQEDEEHDKCSCWCCCMDCDFLFDDIAPAES